ncbi:TIGR03619 family F420-dependent LLM class oxidoreductase [Catenulispora rubra]|uniref:TIGR03619 family F420-dependent LLM class oxidoreductase n=1 Tax=Catenulispora rubra TaxID=280293 RepID=UPI0018923B1C|nr:TIGR03619 family F420-dependent LLM class oxidoreductase [Catenulispora rubra]
MKIGLVLPQTSQYDLRTDVVTVASGAEVLGYSSLWAYERTLFPLQPRDGAYGVPGLPWPDVYRSTAEPLTVLTLAAAATSVIRLGTCVLVAGLHQPQHLARTFATLDQATGGGRVTAGLGVGWSQDEFLAAGADFRSRGRSLEETLDAFQALWGADPVTYRDSRMRIDDAVVGPKPLGRIPVLIGGGSSAGALDRIARRADGWLATGVPAAVMGEQWKRICEAAIGHGRTEDAVGLTPLMHVAPTATAAGPDRVRFHGSVGQVVSDIAEMAEIGAGEGIVAITNAGSAKELLDKAAALITALDGQGLRDR